MPLDIPPGFGSIIHSLRLASDPEPMALTYGVELVGSGTPQEHVNDAHDAMGDFMSSVIPAEYSLLRTELRFTDVAGGATTISVATGDRPGGGAAAALPQNCAYLVHKRTAAPGRRGRGRLFIPGVPEGLTDARGLISAAQVTGMQTALNLLLARYSGDGTTPLGKWMVVLHTIADLAVPGPPPNRVTALTCDPTIATQRRRLR